MYVSFMTMLFLILARYDNPSSPADLADIFYFHNTTIKYWMFLSLEVYIYNNDILLYNIEIDVIGNSPF